MWNNSYYTKPYKLSGDSIIDGIFKFFIYCPFIIGWAVYLSIISGLILIGIKWCDSNTGLLIVLACILFTIVYFFFVTDSEFADAYFDENSNTNDVFCETEVVHYPEKVIFG